MNQEVIKKLGIDKLSAKAILNLPTDIMDFDGLDFDTALIRQKYDLVFSFVFSLDEFKERLITYIQEHRLTDNGVLYFAYPKKGNKRYDAYIGRDDILPAFEIDEEGYVFRSSVKFNKMVSLNNVFTIIGLKNVKRKSRKSSQPSQCVADYAERIPEIEAYFHNNPDVLNLFRKLTPGYQKGWACYVLGVKTEVTRLKRFIEMESILRQGYKSIDLYRQNKK